MLLLEVISGEATNSYVFFFVFFLNIIITFSSQAAFALSEKRLRCRREITQARQREDALS